jgi:hypothetical protein
MSKVKKVIEIDNVTGRRFYITKGGSKMFMCKFDGCMNIERIKNACTFHGAVAPRCKFDGCINKRRQNGRCVIHGSLKTKCKIIDCKNGVINSGLCMSHGSTKRICKFDDCKNRIHIGGFCYRHGLTKKIRLECSINGCNNVIINNNVCTRHGASRSKCKIDGCNNSVVNKNLCLSHGAKLPKSRYCNTCQMILLSDSRRQLGITECSDCKIRGGNINDKPIRLELQWLKKLEEWNYFPSIHDKVIKDNECNVTNRRRVDFMFITDSVFPCHVLIECDENSHGHIPLECEMKRLQDVHDQIISNTCRIKPLLVIRFNPNNADTEMIEKELKKSLNEIFIHKNFVLGDARGVNIYSIIGYGTKRTYLYDSEEIVKKIKV